MSERAGQSPPPETQKGDQQGNAPSNGQGVNEGTQNKEESKSQLEGFSSNPKGPLDDHVKEVAKKTVKNDAGDVKV